MDAIIFDIDGTLLQSDATDDVMYLEAVREVLGSVSLRPTWSMYTQFTAAGILAEILHDNGIDKTVATVTAVRDRFVANVLGYVSEHGAFVEIPGAKAFVESLHNSPQHRVAYAAGGWRGAALLKLSGAGFPVAGIPLVTSDDHCERQEIMLLALRQLTGDFSTITYYGDGHWDVAAAKALGWQFVAVGKKLNGLAKYDMWL